MLRIAFIGISHWHAPMYFWPAARLPGVSIVGVSDPNTALVTGIADRLQTKGHTDYRAMLTETRPDLVFSFGRHCDMAKITSFLVDEEIPFIVEKPGGMNAAQVSAVRDRAKAKGLYAGSGFNFRAGDFYRIAGEVIGDNPVTHASFRYIAGGPYRYREDNSAWMLDPAQSGGGSTINLSVHFIDMFRSFSRSVPKEVASLLGSFTWQLPIEDYSSLIMRSDSAVCTVETGYTYPAGQHGIFDLRFSIRTTRHYIVARSDNVIEVRRSEDGLLTKYSAETSNLHMYPPFVTQSIDRFLRGEPPLADLDDLVGVIEVVDAAFASSRSGGAVQKVES
jgi:predicted dehydrogenase